MNKCKLKEMVMHKVATKADRPLIAAKPVLNLMAVLSRVKYHKRINHCMPIYVITTNLRNTPLLIKLKSFKLNNIKICHI
jgi:hypothetical protein